MIAIRRLLQPIDGVLVEKVLDYWESVLAIEKSKRGLAAMSCWVSGSHCESCSGSDPTDPADAREAFWSHRSRQKMRLP